MRKRENEKKRKREKEKKRKREKKKKKKREKKKGDRIKSVDRKIQEIEGASQRRLH